MDSVVRAARAELEGPPVWQRPSSGPGARSQSADARLRPRLQPLPQSNGLGASPSPTNKEAAAGPGSKHLNGGAAADPRHPSRQGRPSSGPPRSSSRSHREACSSVPSAHAVPQVQVVRQQKQQQAPAAGHAATPQQRRGPLLRRLCESSTPPSPSASSDGDITEGILLPPSPTGSSKGPREDRFIAEQSLCAEKFVDARAAGGGTEDLETEEAVEAELAQLEAQLQQREAVLAATRAREGALAAKLAASERRAGRLGETVAKMEAGLREAAAEAEVPHRALRRGPGPSAGRALASTAVSSSPVPPTEATQEGQDAPVAGFFGATEAPDSPRELGKLLGTWTRARAALGI